MMSQYFNLFKLGPC